MVVLKKTQDIKKDTIEKRQAIRRKNFIQTILAEERKVRMQVKKQALLRMNKDIVEEKREEDKLKKVCSGFSFYHNYELNQ